MYSALKNKIIERTLLIILLLFGLPNFFMAQIVQKNPVPESKKVSSTPVKPSENKESKEVLVLKVYSNVDCYLYVDGESKGELNQDVVKKISFKKGEFLIKAVSKLDSKDVYTTTYPVDEIGTEKMLEIDLRKVRNDRFQKYIEKIKRFDKIIETNPNDAVSINNRGWCKCMIKDYKGCIEDADKALLISPDDPGFLDTKGYAFFLSGNYSEAILVFENALLHTKENELDIKKAIDDHLLAAKDALNKK